MFRNFLKFLVITFIAYSSINASNINADSHTPNMSFNFLPKFVHYQGEINVNGKSLSEIKTSIDFIDVIFISTKQTVKVDGKLVELEEGQFKFTTFYQDPIPSKYHVDIGPGVPENTKFDIFVAGIKAKEFITFQPTPESGCPVSNCFNRTLDLNIDTIPTPTPTPVPPTPTPLPTVNPSFYSGQIIVGSSPVPDGVEVFAKIDDYISEIVETSEGRYTISVNPKTVNYVGQDIYLVIQGNESITSISFSPDEFISDANFLFQDFEMIIKDDTPTPEPEKIIVIATPTPEPESSQLQSNDQNIDGEGCGGGSSGISIFSILLSGLIIFLYNKSRKRQNSPI